jgi:hypothetical protein
MVEIGINRGYAAKLPPGAVFHDYEERRFEVIFPSWKNR